MSQDGLRAENVRLKYKVRMFRDALMGMGFGPNGNKEYADYWWALDDDGHCRFCRYDELAAEYEYEGAIPWHEDSCPIARLDALLTLQEDGSSGHRRT